MRRLIAQVALAPIYELALRVRALSWRLRRPIIVGVRALIIDDDAVLLIRHRSGARPWAMPGGGVMRYERLVEAVRREAFEETGAPVRVERLLGIYDAFHSSVSNVVAVFVCTPLGPPRPPLSLEVAEARYFRLDDLPDNVELNTHRRIADYRAGLAGVSKPW